MKKGNISRKEECPECGNLLIYDPQSGERVCTSCGLVVTEQEMDMGPEWRAFNPEQRRTRPRTGAPTTFTVHDKGLSTTIRDIKRDAYGRKISPSTQVKMKRLRKWQRRSKIHSASERNLAFAMAELNKLGHKLYLPKSVLETAAQIYRKALKKKLIRGRSIVEIVGACLYAACRRHQIARSTKEISEFITATEKDINRSYCHLFWNLDVVDVIIDKLSIYIKKIAGKLNLSEPTKNLAWQILQRAKKRRLTAGRGPSGMAAAAIYIACELNDEKRTQKEIAKTAGVTEVTIRNRYKGLVESLQVNFDTKTWEGSYEVQIVQDLTAQMGVPIPTVEA